MIPTLEDLSTLEILKLIRIIVEYSPQKIALIVLNEIVQKLEVVSNNNAKVPKSL